MMLNLKEKYLQTFETLRKIHKLPSFYEETRFGDDCLTEMDSFVENVILPRLNEMIEAYLTTTASKEFIGNFSIDCSIIKSNGNVFVCNLSDSVFCFKTKAFMDKKLFEYCAEKYYLDIEDIKFHTKDVKVTFSIAF